MFIYLNNQQNYQLNLDRLIIKQTDETKSEFWEEGAQREIFGPLTYHFYYLFLKYRFLLFMGILNVDFSMPAFSRKSTKFLAAHPGRGESKDRVTAGTTTMVQSWYLPSFDKSVC